MSNPGARKRLPVLVFGPHIAAIRVLRRLTGRGVRCYVVDETDDIIVRSRWYRPAERTLPETSDSGVLAEYLAGLRLPRAVLVPCSDNWTLAASGLPEELRDRFPRSLPSRAAVEQFVDKRRFSEITDQLGIPRPRTVRLAGPADLDNLTDEELRRHSSSRPTRRSIGVTSARKGRSSIPVARRNGFCAPLPKPA